MGSSQNGLGRVWGAEACVALKEKSSFLSPDLQLQFSTVGSLRKPQKCTGTVKPAPDNHMARVPTTIVVGPAAKTVFFPLVPSQLPEESYKSQGQEVERLKFNPRPISNMGSQRTPE